MAGAVSAVVPTAPTRHERSASTLPHPNVRKTRDLGPAGRRAERLGRFSSSRPRNDASEMLNGSPKTAVSDGSDLVAAAATAPAGIDKDKDNDENGEGNEPATDPERLA